MWLVFLLPGFIAARTLSQKQFEGETLPKRLPEFNFWAHMMNISAILSPGNLTKSGNWQRGRALNGGGGGKSIFDMDLNETKLVEENPEDEAKSLRIRRRHIVPLLVGITLKFLSTIPLIIGKLAILGSFAIIASKMALLITLITTLGNYLAHGFRSIIYHHQMYHDEPHDFYKGP